jgi:uncharacterized membrane protein YfcA
VLPHLLFLGCVALATYVQNLTGFAFALILLGLVGAFHILPVVDAANAATVLVLVNAVAYLRHHRPRGIWTVVRPPLLGSLAGVIVGVALLSWLTANALEMLRLLLGVAIVGCAALLLLQARPHARRSGIAAQIAYGGVGGIMAGLFASGGPPIVFHLYRQPLDRGVVKQCLMLIFAGNAILRLALLVGSGQFSALSLLLAVEAVPVVYAVTWWHARHPLQLSAGVAKGIVSALLLVTGAVLIGSSLPD